MRRTKSCDPPCKCQRLTYTKRSWTLSSRWIRKKSRNQSDLWEKLTVKRWSSNLHQATMRTQTSCSRPRQAASSLTRAQKENQTRCSKTAKRSTSRLTLVRATEKSKGKTSWSSSQTSTFSGWSPATRSSSCSTDRSRWAAESSSGLEQPKKLCGCR